MRCALVCHLVATTIFVVVVSSAPELCVFEDHFGQKYANCRRYRVGNIFDFIPPISLDISAIDLSGLPLKQLPYNAFRNVSSQSSLSMIILKQCQISHVDAGALLNLPNLTYILWSHNDIKQIDSKLFRDTKQLKYVYMDHNKIEVVPSGLFQNLLKLVGVHLQYNHIRQMEWFSFKNTPSLHTIDLSNNQIEFMDILFKDKIDYLKYLSLYHNPWKCDCKLGPLYEFLIKTDRLNQHGLICEKPPTLQGRRWRDLSRDEFVCGSGDATSTQDSVVTSAELMKSTEADDNVPVMDYYGTRCQAIDTGVPQPSSNQNWILYTILILQLVCVTAVIIGVVFVVRHTSTIVRRGSAPRTNARNMDSDLSMLIIRSRTVSERGDSSVNMADVDAEQTSIHHHGTREAPIN